MLIGCAICDVACRATMWELLRPQLLLGSAVAFVAGLLSTVARPYILREIINQIAANNVELDEAVLLIAILATVVFFEGWLSVLARHLLSDNLGTSMITALLSLILGKVVRGVDQAAATGANVANLVGNDTSRRFMDLMLVSQLPMAVGSMSGGLAMVILFIGWEPAVVGVTTIVVVMFVNMMIARRLGRIEKMNLQLADRRIGILGEIVGAIKAVKFFAWEEPCEDLRQRSCPDAASLTPSRRPLHRVLRLDTCSTHHGASTAAQAPAITPCR